MEAKHMATEIARFVNDENGEMAKLRIEDLLTRVGYSVRRWDMRLPEKSKANLARCREHLSDARNVLYGRPISELTQIKKQRLAKACGQVINLFAEEHGAAMKAMDSEVSNG
jgi:hypothetical protein